jgi:DAACS family dicarboxylate/amino acid:cation (Na+ or H+) symporter
VKLHTQMLIGLLLGAFAGAVAHATFGDHPALETVVDYVARPIGQVFLRLLFMLVLPMVFSALALGIAELGDLGKLGRIGLKTLAYTVSVSAIAVLVGVVAVDLFRPGDGLPEDVRARLLAGAAERATAITGAPPPKSGVDLLVRIVPENIVRAGAENDMLALMFFAVMTGVGLVRVRTPGAERVKGLLEGVYELAMDLVGLVIRVAPIGVFALLFALTAELGAGVLVQLGSFVLVVLGALLFHQLVVYSAAVSLLGGMSPARFFSGSREAMLTAFSTASSSATLPTTLRVADELGLPSRVSRFVLTVGATANQNGTALFEGVTVLFLAQFYGVELTFGQQIAVASVCVLGGVGTAGVPAGSLPVVVMILGMVGVPAEGIGLVLGIDRFLDMCRTTLNVTGDLAAAVVVSRGEEAA